MTEKRSLKKTPSHLGWRLGQVQSLRTCFRGDWVAAWCGPSLHNGD